MKKIRNDLGGHFGLAAARYSIENLSTTTMAKIEIVEQEHQEIWLHFAMELAATALGRHLGEDTHNEIGTLFNEILDEAYRSATQCVQILAALHLLPRFGH